MALEGSSNHDALPTKTAMAQPKAERRLGLDGSYFLRGPSIWIEDGDGDGADMTGSVCPCDPEPSAGDGRRLTPIVA